jgi:septum formation protein
MDNWISQRIILASSSPRRADLFRQAGLEFEIIPSKFVENNIFKLPPVEYAIELSYRKTSDVANKIKEGIIVGADTIVVIDNKILEKPDDEHEAFQMLKTLSGKKHLVITGFTIIKNPGFNIIKNFEETYVTFRNLSDTEIESYISTGEPMDKAGSYGAQGRGASFIEKIEGCFYNVVGFPLAKFFKVMNNW